MLKMLEDRLNTKDNELREREAEFKKMYEMHNRVTTQMSDANAKLRKEYSQVKTNLVEHV